MGINEPNGDSRRKETNTVGWFSFGVIPALIPWIPHQQENMFFSHVSLSLSGILEGSAWPRRLATHLGNLYKPKAAPNRSADFCSCFAVWIGSLAPNQGHDEAAPEGRIHFMGWSTGGGRVLVQVH